MRQPKIIKTITNILATFSTILARLDSISSIWAPVPVPARIRPPSTASRRTSRYPAFLTLLVSLSLVHSNASAVTMTDIGTLGGEVSFAFAINDANQVVGVSLVPDGETHMFLYRNGQMQDLSPFGQGIFSSNLGINNGGQIASGVFGNDGVYYPAIFDPQTQAITILGSLGGVAPGGFAGIAQSINNYGQAVGYAFLSSGVRQAFLYENGAIHNMGDGTDSYAIAINDRGHVIGGGAQGAFIYANGVTNFIRPFGSAQSYAYGINRSGQVVGEYLTPDNTAFHAYIYKDGVSTDIGSSSSTETVAYAINDYGQAVGATWVLSDESCRQCSERPHAFIYENGVMTDLNDLLPAGSGWELSWALSINNNGYITGYGIIKGQYHAFIVQMAPHRPMGVPAITKPRSLGK